MQIFNLLLASLGSAMSLVLLVVVLIHYIYLDVKPELVRDIPSLWITALLLGVIATGGWFCAYARARKLPYFRWYEAGSACVGGVCVFLLVTLLR